MTHHSLINKNQLVHPNSLFLIYDAPTCFGPLPSSGSCFPSKLLNPPNLVMQCMIRITGGYVADASVRLNVVHGKKYTSQFLDFYKFSLLPDIKHCSKQILWTN
jgi:hypothetical protein